jgi:energy-coupling factor transporter ATP-binding protein EcfA2
MENRSDTDQAVRYYTTFEDREAAFQSRVSGLVPPRHVGPRRFWEAFVDIGRRLAKTPPDFSHAVIPANPADSLAYSTPRQELIAMQLRSQPAAVSEPYTIVADRYGLTLQLDQPTRTLSGGETALLAMAKAHMAARTVATLTVASPYNWLSAANRRHFLTLQRHYRDCQRSVSILALEGEDDLSPLAGRQHGPVSAGADLPTFDLVTHRLTATLGFAFGTGRPPATAEFRDTDLKLQSPCLVGGDNGNGKSLLAKIACGAISYQGLFRLKGLGGRLPARLLFQDVISQTLFRPFVRLAASGTAGELYHRLRQELPADLSERCRALDRIPPSDPPRLLEVKLLLTAVRLEHRPHALVMDEPDWGLSRSAAVALVDSVIRVSHQQGVPVLLISHKPWWDRLASSRLTVTKTIRATGPSRRLDFRLQPVTT